MTMLPVDLGTSPLMYGGGLSADQFQVPNLKPKGMFGGGLQNALLAAAAGFMARRSPAMSQNLMAPLMGQRQQALAEAQNQRELQRQKDLYLFKLQNPEPQQYGEFEQRLIASGIQPGTPQWVAANQAAVQNTTDPVIMTPQGPMLRSMIVGAMPQNRPAIGAVIDDPRVQGGPAAPPSATFPRPY